MSEQIIQRAARVTDATAAMPWLVTAGVYALLMLLAPRLLADPDTYSHIALGRWIFAHHAVPTVDPFSQTMRGTPWIAFEWGSELAYASAHALGGWLAVVALAAAAAAAAFGLLTHFLLRHWQPMPTLIAVLAALVLVSPHILARPHLLALPLLVTWVAAPDPGRGRKARPVMVAAGGHGAVGESARQLHVRVGDGRRGRLRSALECDTGRTHARRAAMDLIWLSCARRRLPQSLRRGNDPGDVQHGGAGPGARNHHRMAAAGFQPPRRLRTHRTRRLRHGALSRDKIAAVAHRDAVRGFALEPVAAAPCRSARPAGAVVPGASAGRTIRRRSPPAASARPRAWAPGCRRRPACC